MSRANDESKHPGDRDLPDRPMARGDHPSYKSNQPAANDSFGEDERKVPIRGLQTQVRQSVSEVGRERSSLHYQPAEKYRSSNIGHENSHPKPQRIQEMLAFIQNQDHRK